MKTSSLLVVWFFLLGTAFSVDYTTFNKLVLPAHVTGPESAAFDRAGGGPYVTVADGRILKWAGPIIGFVDFAYTSPDRTKSLCDGTNNPSLRPTCGRPLAISFNYKTSDLYITDAFFGLLVVGFNGGLATQLSTGYNYLSGIDVESYTGNVYMTDDSSSGKLLKYDPIANRVTVLIDGIAGGGGPAVSSDRSYVLVPDYVNKKILRYWMQGPKVGTNEVFMADFGSPKMIKRAVNDGEFWVAVDQKQSQGLRVNGSAMVLQTVPLTQYLTATVAVVQETNGALFVGSNHTDFVGVYTN